MADHLEPQPPPTPGHGDLMPPRWHADGCYVCHYCDSRRAGWFSEDGPRHHNTDCIYRAALVRRHVTTEPR